jgi:hypothetical protein
MGGRRLVGWTPLHLEECKSRLTHALGVGESEHPMHFPLAEPPSEEAHRVLAILNQARGRPQSEGAPRVDAVVAGHLSRQHVTLFVTKQVGGVPFATPAPRLVLTLQAEPSGTRFEGTFRMARAAKWFFWVWVTGLLLMYTILLIAFARGAERHGSLLLLLGGPPILLAFGAGLLVFSRWISRGDDRTMIEFLERVLGTSVQDGDQAR